MTWSESFAPESDSNTSVLVLGSMPGMKSLDAVEYYAHPRNAFWSIIEELFSIDRTMPYRKRVELLNKRGVGLWDVYKTCYREGSLDSNIDVSTAQVNNFERLLTDNPRIKTIIFNGKASEKAYLKCVSYQHLEVKLIGLPSTSPANASLSFEQKLNKWEVLRDLVFNR